MAYTARQSRTLLRVREVANDLDSSNKFVYGLISSGQLRAIRVGTEYRIRAADFEAFLASQATA